MAESDEISNLRRELGNALREAREQNFGSHEWNHPFQTQILWRIGQKLTT